jgi:HSP20 family protein
LINNLYISCFFQTAGRYHININQHSNISRRLTMSFYINTTPYQLARRWAARAQTADSARPLAVDVMDQGEEFVLTAFVPGLQAENLNIQIVDDALSIEGEFSQHEGEFLMSELPAGAFRRTLRLPTALDAEKAAASIENGILTLRVPKAESARPRTIKVASK